MTPLLQSAFCICYFCVVSTALDRNNLRGERFISAHRVKGTMVSCHGGGNVVRPFSPQQKHRTSSWASRQAGKQGVSRVFKGLCDACCWWSTRGDLNHDENSPLSFPWGSLWIRITGVGRPTLTVDSIIPGAGPRLTTKREWGKLQCAPLCFLTVDALNSCCCIPVPRGTCTGQVGPQVDPSCCEVFCHCNEKTSQWVSPLWLSSTH